MAPGSPYGVLAGGAARGLRGLRHARTATRDLDSSTSRVLLPRTTSAAPAHDVGVLTVTTWNVHHGNGPDRSGAPRTLEAQIDWLRRDRSILTLLQEVTPWQARRVVEGTGRVGYLTQTTPSQGNLMLVATGPEVVTDTRHTVSWPFDERGGGSDRWRAAFGLGGREARVVQMLRLRLADGVMVTVANMHLSTGASSRSVREREAEALLAVLDTEPSYPVIGGGDLNAGPDGPAPELLRSNGFHVESAGIDYVFARGVRGVEITSVDPHRGETRLSDHPAVRAFVTL